MDRSSNVIFRSLLCASSGQDLLRVKGALLLVFYGILQTFLIFLGSYSDGTLILEGDGKGFFEHYGVWAILITDIMLMITVALAHSIFRNTIASIEFKSKSEHRLFIRQHVRELLNFLYLRGNSKFVYYLMVLIGLLAWLNNLYQTSEPEKFYGNDVFDQIDYTYGFLANKINLFISWVLIYPVCLFVMVTLCFQTRLILDLALKNNGLKGNVFHPDKCYGFASFGWLNISLLTPYLFVFIVMYSLSITHKAMYQSLILPMILLTAVFFLVSFLMIKPLVGHASKLEQETYKHIRKRLMESPGISQDKKYETYLMRICYATSSGSPYSVPLKYGIVFIRLTPAAISMLSLI